MQGRVEEGMAQIHQGLAAWQTIGTSHLRAGFLALLAEVYGQTGRYVEGLAALDEALDIVKTTGGRLNEAEYYGLKGEILWHVGNRLEDAEACLQYALTGARRQQARSRELRAALRLSRLLAVPGQVRRSVSTAGCRSTAGSPRALTPPTSRRPGRCLRPCADAAREIPGMRFNRGSAAMLPQAHAPSSVPRIWPG